MGACRYCGLPAGLLRSVHEACKQKLQTVVASYLSGNGSPSELDVVAGEIKAAGPKAQDDFVDTWCKAVTLALNDGVLSSDEESRLVSAANRLGVTQAELDRRGIYTQLIKAAVLREVLEGKIPERVQVEGLGINLQKSERIVWLFGGTEYLTFKTTRTYKGSSHGLSIRIMKGVYYRPSVFQATPVQSTELVSHGTGDFVVTNKHVYFMGRSKTFRIPYQKIVAFEPYQDGIGLQRAAATAKPERFKTGDGWFTYNLVMNLAQT